MEGKTALGASSPAKPALHIPEPLSTTKAATSSSHILLDLFVYCGRTENVRLHYGDWECGENNLRPILSKQNLGS